MRSLWQDYRTRFLQTAKNLPWFGPAFSAILVASFVNVLTDTLTRINIWLGWAAVLAFGLLALGVTYIYTALEARRRQRDLGPLRDRLNPSKHRGLISIFSREATLQEAIEYHQPDLEQCWLLATPQVQERAAEFAAAFSGVGITIHAVGDLYDSETCYQIVRQIYKQETVRLNIPADQVISDITGGTKPMAMGMIVACLEGGHPIEHVPTAFDAAGQPTGPLPPIQIMVQKGYSHRP